MTQLPWSNYTSFIFFQAGHLRNAGFEKIALSTREGRVCISPKTAGEIQGLRDFQRNFGYEGIWLKITELFGKTSNQVGSWGTGCGTCQIFKKESRPGQI